MIENPGKLISILYRKSQIYWAAILKEHGISSAEYPILLLLNKKDGITQEEIASGLSIDKSAITRVIQSLLKKGFIEREKGCEDRRCNFIHLTPKGRSCKEPIEAGKKGWNDILMKEMSEDQRQLVVQLLEQMVHNIQ